MKQGAWRLLWLLLIPLCFGFTTNPLKKQPLPIAPIKAQAPRPAPLTLEGFLSRVDDSISTVVPFNKVGNLIVIKGKVDGVEGNFILDTGAPSLVLNMVYFRDKPITLVQDETHTSVTGTAEMIHKTQLRSFQVGTMEYIRPEAHLIDLGHIENSKGIKIFGLIGYELLQNIEMIIDYDLSLLHLHRIGRKEGNKYASPHLEADKTFSTHNLDIKDRQIITQGEMNGKKLRFVMDTGAETNILDSRLPENILDSVAIVGRMTIRGTGSRIVEALRGNAANLRIGNETIAQLPVLVANLEQTCFAQNMGVHGVLGLHFTQLRKIGFNFVTRKMYTWK